MQKQPTDLDLHSLQRQGISGFSRTRVKGNEDTFKGGNSVKIVWPLLKRDLLKGKNFAPLRSNFFSFKEDLFSAGM